MLLPQLSSLLVDEVVEQGSALLIRARTQAAVVACPQCRQLTGRVHAYHRRLGAAAGRYASGRAWRGSAVVVELRVRRLVCQTSGCPRRTLREQVPALAQRWARRTRQLTALIADLAVLLAGRAGAAVLAQLGAPMSRSTVLRVLMALPTPTRPAPAVLSVDDFALRRRRRYATLLIDAAHRRCSSTLLIDAAHRRCSSTLLIDAVTHRRVDVLPDRTAATLAAWLPGCARIPRWRWSAGTGRRPLEAIRQGAPQAVQVSHRCHLWHNLAKAVEKAVEKTVIAHSRCWHTGPPRQSRPLDERTKARHAAVHELLEQGVGLLECARRLGWALNTIKRYARADTAEDLQRPPRYRDTLVDPYRDHLRPRPAEQPQLPVTRLLTEIRALGYTGSANLLVRYLNQGRAAADRTPPPPRRLATWLMTKPDKLPSHHREHLHDLLARCPQLTVPADRVREFAGLLTARLGHDLDAWMTTVAGDDLPALHAFVHGLRMDLPAVVAGLTLPHSNGPIEGTNTKVKFLKRQMYGRAHFPLLRQRILLA